MANASFFVEESDIYDNTIESVLKILRSTGSFFNRDSNDNSVPVHVVRTNRTLMTRRQVGEAQKHETIPPIVCGVFTDQLRKNRTGYNETALKHYGTYRSTSDDENSQYREYLAPTTLVLTARFQTRNVKYLDGIAKDWLYSHERFNFVLSDEEDPNYEIHIACRPSEELNNPELQYEDIGEFFELEAQLEVDTYVGIVKRIPRFNSTSIGLLNVSIGKPVPGQTAAQRIAIDQEVIIKGYKVSFNDPTIQGMPNDPTITYDPGDYDNE